MEWQKTAIEIIRIDSEHKFSRKNYDGVAAGIIKNQKVEIFYSKEHGKKFQNILDWLSQLEMKILVHFPQPDEKVAQVIAHLSPKIQAVAKVQNFKTYEGIKTWLKREYLDVDALIENWQKEVTSIKVNTIGDVPLYVEQIKGTLNQILQTASGGDEGLIRKWFSPTSLAYLVQKILKPLTKPTGTDQYRVFMADDWAPELATAADLGRAVKPELMLEKMEARLDIIKNVSKAEIEMNRDAQSKMMLETSDSKEGKRFASIHQQAMAEGVKDPLATALKRYQKGEITSKDEKVEESHPTKPKGPAKLAPKTRKAFVKIQMVDVGNNNLPCYVRQKATCAAMKKVFTISQEDLEKAKEWEKPKLKLRCWVCSKSNPHEFFDCGEALQATNKIRMLAAQNKDQGPGMQCFTCLKGSCFAQRCLNAATERFNPKNSRKQLSQCTADLKLINLVGCWGCKKDISIDPVKKERFKPLHVLVCAKEDHLEDCNQHIAKSRLCEAYGNGIRKVDIHYCSLPVKVETEIKDQGKEIQNHSSGNEGVFKNRKKKNEEWCEFDPKIPKVPESEYKGSENSELFDTNTGRKEKFDQSSKENRSKLMTEPEGMPVYFMQTVNLDSTAQIIFFDSGAMMNLIVTDTARELGLKMVDRNGMAVIGAGNHLSVTEDGKYELLLGRGPKNEIYRLICCGMGQLTGPMLQANWSSIHGQVRKRAQELYNTLDPESRLEPDELLPAYTGGNIVKIIIGLSLPIMQPKIIFELPDGLLVAKSRIKDIWGSRVVFGGIHQAFDNFFQASYVQCMNKSKVEQYRAYQTHCFQKYRNFMDSVRLDKIHLKKWDKLIEADDDKEIIIANSEEKRSVQLMREKNVRDIVKDGEKYLFEKMKYNDHEDFDQKPEKIEKTFTSKKKVKWADEAMNFTVYRADTGCLNEHNNVLYSTASQSSTVLEDGRMTEVDNLINTVFGDQYDSRKTGFDDVLFESRADREACIAAIAQSNSDSKSELVELLKKEIDPNVWQGKPVSWNTPPADMVNPKILMEASQKMEKASFEALIRKENFTKDILTAYDRVAKGAHTCTSCSCSEQTVDHLFEEIEQKVINIDAKSCQKIKQVLRTWEEEETTGTGIDYRCAKCVDCKECLKSGRTRARSIREDDEQNVIESSVRIDWDKKICLVYLPWIKSPQELTIRWGSDSNLKQAKHFLRKMLQKSEKDRKSLVDFWDELKKREVVCRLKDLSDTAQKSIADAPVKHFYPWNCVFKESITTPCRMVVDSRCSGLNEHLAKGHNTLNNLQMLLMRFRSFKHVGSYDISKMYNMLRIEESHLQYQLILWVDEMNPANDPEIWVMTRAIYGTISSGNQAEVAIRRGASVMESKYPEGAFTIIHETYVDDGVPGRDKQELLAQALDEVEKILNMIGFSLKCTTMSGQEELSKKASSDGISIGIAGYCWRPKEDKIGLAVKECNFNPNIRGAKAPNKHEVKSGKDIDDEIFPQELTRAQVVGKVAELFDLIGIFMPITVEGKIMARKVAHLDWKDVIPQELMESWKVFVRKVQDTRNLEIDRCVFPKDVEKTTELEIFEVHDGSQHCSAATIYVRSKNLVEDTYHTRLLFSRSMLCPPDQSIPRNELQAAHLGAVTVFITRIALKEKVGLVRTFGDSRVALCWVKNPDLKLKNWCFARVQEIHRISGSVDHYWVAGDQNIADLATKGLASVDDVKNLSDWQKGLTWMHLEIEELRQEEVILNFEEVMTKLDAKDQTDLGTEQHPTLPDLAVGGRRDANPELDFDVLQITTPSLLKTNMYELMDLKRPTEGLPKLKNIQGGLFCFMNHLPQASKYDLGKGLSYGTVKSESESHTLICRGTGDFGFGNSRNKIPQDKKLQEIPEVHSGLLHGFSPREISSALINYPRNFSLVVGGVNMERLKICEYLINPIHFGWRTAFKTTAVCIKFIWTTKHKAHQILEENHYTDHQIKVRKKLKDKCQICQSITETEGVNLAYLDSITSGNTSVNKYDQLVRAPEAKAWKPKTVLAHITTRAKAKKLREQKEEKPTVNSEIWKEIEIDDRIKVAAWNYYMRIASKEVTDVLNNKDKKLFKFDKNERIWKYYGRLLERTSIQTRDIELDEFFDSGRISYIQPVGLATSPFVYSLVMDLHWNVFPHKGVQATQRLLAQILYVIKGGNLVRAIREDCQQCRLILKKKMQEKMGEVPLEKLIISPAFYAVQIDHCGPFLAFSKHNQRATLKIDALVITCINTSAVSINALETLEAPSIIKALLRHSCRYGYPYVAFIDQGPGLIKACNTDFNLMTHASIIKETVGMRVVAKPTQAHESRGKVEKAVQALKHFLEDNKSATMKQSILDWETTFLFISNFLNNLPVARLVKKDSMTSDVNEILTPNRLLLGRNNDRTPCFVEDCLSPTYSERLLRNSAINRAWFTMLTKLVPTLSYRPKWHDTSENPPVIGDYVLFLFKESKMGREHEEWKPGQIYDISKSENSNTFIFYIEYRILIRKKGDKVENSKVETHTTSRVLRELVLLYTEEELSSLHGSPEHLKRLSKKLN